MIHAMPHIARLNDPYHDEFQYCFIEWNAGDAES